MLIMISSIFNMKTDAADVLTWIDGDDKLKKKENSMSWEANEYRC